MIEAKGLNLSPVTESFASYIEPFVRVTVEDFSSGSNPKILRPPIETRVKRASNLDTPADLNNRIKEVSWVTTNEPTG